MSAATNDNAYRDLAKLVVDLQKRVDGLSTSQLGHSSLENTRINTYDGEGRPVGAYGRLPDGTYGSATLSGPTPPTPSAPRVESIRGIGLKITWDGVFAVATDVVPLEGGRLEVYVSTIADITGATVPRTTIESPRGGEVTLSVSFEQSYYVAFAFRAASGKLSEISETIGPVIVPRATAEDLDVDFEAMRGTKIWYGSEEPVTDRADLWLRHDGDDEYTALRFDPVFEVWREMQDQGVVGALQLASAANEAAASKVRIFPQASAPTGLTADDVGDMWIDTDDDNVSYTWSGAAWEKRQIGSGSIVPNSLVASDVIATGTISAALFEATLILTTTIIAGDPNGTHARMTPTGFRVYAADPVDGVPNEVIRLGTDTDDYFGISNALGELVASFDDQGGGSLRNLTVDGDPIFQGVPLSQQMDEARAGRLLGFFRGKLTADITPIDGEIGIVEVNAKMVAGRSYFIKAHFGWDQRVPNTEVQFRFRSTRAAEGEEEEAPAPTVTSTSEETWWRTHRAERRRYTEDLELLYNCTRTGRHRFLLTAGLMPTPALFGGVSCHGEVSIAPVANSPTSVWVNFPWKFDSAPRVFTSVSSTVPGTTVTGHGAHGMTTAGTNIAITRTNTTPTTVFWQAHGDAVGDSRITIDNALLTTMSIVDAGPTPPTSGQQSAGGGTIGTNPSGGAVVQPPSPPTTKQQYSPILYPVGWRSWRGNGTIRTDIGNSIVQGPDPSGFNGIGKGMWWFDLPSITGTVDRVEVYLHAEHWWNNSGGLVCMNISDQRGTDPNFFKLRADWYGLHLPKPGGRWINLPADWLPFFRGTNNNAFNGRAMAITAGPGSGNQADYGRLIDCRLRVWYTQ